MTFIVAGIELPARRELPARAPARSTRSPMCRKAMAALGCRDDDEFAELLLNEGGVAVVPGSRLRRAGARPAVVRLQHADAGEGDRAHARRHRGTPGRQDGVSAGRGCAGQACRRTRVAARLPVRVVRTSAARLWARSLLADAARRRPLLVHARS